MNVFNDNYILLKKNYSLLYTRVESVWLDNSDGQGNDTYSESDEESEGECHHEEVIQWNETHKWKGMVSVNNY